MKRNIWVNYHPKLFFCIEGSYLDGIQFKIVKEIGCVAIWNEECVAAEFKGASTHPIWDFIRVKYCPSMKRNIWVKYHLKLLFCIEGSYLDRI